MRFDGNEFAKKIEELLKSKVESMEKKPKLLILMMGENAGSKKYVEMKKGVGERVGVGVEVRSVASRDELLEEIKRGNGDGAVNGVMVQLPIGDLSKEETESVLREIAQEKDVDGLNPKNVEALESGEQSFIPASVKAVEKILDEAFRYTSKDIDEKLKLGVVGAKGMVGRAVTTRMKRFGMEVLEMDQGDDLGKIKECDVVVSATGVEGLIKEEMVKNGVIGIDLGFPKGDFEAGVEKKSEFFTPVPGGVGPVTVICLLENVVLSVENNDGIW